jgi:hypothetical protein
VSAGVAITNRKSNPPTVKFRSIILDRHVRFLISLLMPQKIIGAVDSGGNFFLLKIFSSDPDGKATENLGFEFIVGEGGNRAESTENDIMLKILTEQGNH